MKRQSTATEHAATKDKSAKRGRASGTATEHATSGTATEHVGLGREIKDSQSSGKDVRFETMLRKACSKAPPHVERLLQEVKTLGHYPQRYKQPTTKVERDSDSLAKKLNKAKGHFTSEVQKYLEAMQANSKKAAATHAATEHAQQAQSLMQQVRKLGHLPRESESHAEEQLLAQQLRKAKANGLLLAYEQELEDFAKTAATRTATEHAQQAQSLMQQVRELGHLPRESQSKPHEQVLARQLREAKANGLLAAFEEELRHMAAADANAITMRLATERAQKVTTLHQQITACVDGRGDLNNPSAVARQVRKMAADSRVLQSPAMQAHVEEMQWMLARRDQQLRAERLAARALEKRRLRQARQRELRCRCKFTLQQLSRSSLQCNCHDFACWQFLWKRDPEIATTLRRTGHHLPFCKLSVEEWQPHQRKDLICPHSGWSFDEAPSDDSDQSSDYPPWDNSDEQGEDYAYRRRETPGGFALLKATAPPCRDEINGIWMPIGDATERPAPGDGLQCCVSHPVRFMDYGIHGRCQACDSRIQCGLLFGGRCDGSKYLKEYVWDEISFIHERKSCAPTITFPGRVSREWLHHLACNVGEHKRPGSDVGVSEAAYTELLKFCGARADYELLHCSFNFAGRLLRSKHPRASSPPCCRALHWNGDGICVQPAVRPRQRPLKLKPEFQMDDADVANHWKHLPLAKVCAADPTVLYRLAETAVNTLRRWPQRRNASSRTEARLAKLLDTWMVLPSETTGKFFCRSRCLARIAKLFNDCTIPDGTATEHSLACWRKDVELELVRMGFGVAGVDAQQVFHHSLQGWPKPKKQLSKDQQMNLLVKAKILDPSSAEIPKSVTKDHFTKRGRASGTATEPAIAKARDLAKFFLCDADFQTYNEEHMKAHDPKAYKWSTGKKLFDYTPHVTKEDWLYALRGECWRERMRNAKLRERYSNDRDLLRWLLSRSYGKENQVWTHFSSDEIAWACNSDPGHATEPPAPYKPFLDNDWCRHCLWPCQQGRNGWRRPSLAERHKMYDMWYYWKCDPQELLWVGGTYARDPTNFPAYQQETAWIYANLRPLRIQPPIELMRLHFARPWKRAPDWPAPRLTRRHEISVEACGAQLYKYMKLHGMLSCPAGLWYGYELPERWFKRSYSNPSWKSRRTKEEREWGQYEQPPALALDHPETPSKAFGSIHQDLLLPFAKRLEHMPPAEDAATEHVFEIRCRDEEDARSLVTADDEDYYGTLG